MPFFSIIIPTYNRASFISAAIDSVLAQTFSDFELLIIDDASTDNTAEIVALYTDTRIRYFKNEKNSERSWSRNRGIALSQGDYICFLDSDDRYLPNHLVTFYEHIEKINKGKALFFSNSLLESDDGKTIEKKVPRIDKKKFAYLLQYTPSPARICIEKSILMENNFDTAIPGIEDLDLWLRIATKYPIIHIEEYTSVYRIHSEMYSLADSNKADKELKYFKYVFARDELKKYLPKASKNRLLSMCHFHLALKSEKNGKIASMYGHIMKSFFLYPEGYNGKTNKILLVAFLYHIPLLGFVLKKIVKTVK